VNKLRLRYSKTQRAKYISHLDLMSTMQRALLRAEIPLQYSQGFNPHPYLSVALPLPVGLDSTCELMDIRVTEETLDLTGIAQKITACLPDGLEVTDCYIPAVKFTEIAWIEIHGTLIFDSGPPADAVAGLRGRYAQKSILISKKTKRGMSDIDIAQHIKDVEFLHGSNITLSAKISAQNPTLSPDNFISALKGEYDELFPDYAFFSRKEIFDSNMTVFK